jgi:hypothetical protein
MPGNEMWDYERTRLELFYREALTEAMIDHDRRGRYRQCVKLFEAVNFLQSLFLNSVPDLGTRSRFIRTSNESATAMLHLLQRTPIYREGWFNTGVAVNTGDLEEFVKFAREKKAEIETLLGIEVRSDLDTKAVQQLGAVLKLIGLKLKRSGSQKRMGQKIYTYHVDEASWRRLNRVVQLRKNAKGWNTLYERYGWDVNELVEEER